MSSGRIVLLVFGIIFLVGSVLLLIGGGGLVGANAAWTDNQGFFTSRTTRLESDSYAITTEPADIDWDADRGMGWCSDPGDCFTVKVEVENRPPTQAIFIGVGPESDVAAYLDNVEYDEISRWSSDSRFIDVEYRRHSGDAVPAPPTTQTFWEASAYGTGTQTLKWAPESGSWVLVVMNQDGSYGIDISATVGVKVPWVFWLGLGMLIAGIIALPAGIVMVYFAARKPK